MAIKFFNENLISDHGIIHTGSFTTAPTGTLYNTSWASFVSNYGYNDGFFDVTPDFLACPWGSTVTKRLFTLRSGNYAQLEIDKTASGAFYNDVIRVKLYNSDDTLTSFSFSNATAHSASDVNNGKFDYYGFVFVVGYDDATNNIWFCTARSSPIAPTTVYIDTNQTSISYAEYIGWLLGSILPDDPYGTIPENENPGTGYGPYDYTSETDLPPSLPSASAAQCGFVSLWNPTITELQGLASYLWTSGLFDINTWRHLFSNPMDCILSVGIIPFVPDRALSKEEIIFCGTSHSAITAYRVPTQMYVIPMGTMHITGMSQGYTDYEPYAKASLFLPYCGTYALSCDEIVDADISLEYHVDIYTGACVAYLTIERDNSNGEHVNAVMYQFTGNMLSTIPVTGADHSNFIQSLLFMGAAIGATVATSGAAAPEIGGAMAAGDAVAGSTALTAATAGSAINTVMSMKPNVMRSGNLSSNAGLLGKQAPTITMTWSNICRPEDEYKLAGMPLHKSGTLSDFAGFTVVSAVHMDNILCTEEEKTMIEELLYKGVII